MTKDEMIEAFCLKTSDPTELLAYKSSTELVE